MKKAGMMIGAAVLFMGGIVPAELPVPTSAPAAKGYDTVRLLREQDKFRGCVVEVRNYSFSVYRIETNASGIYRGSLCTPLIRERGENAGTAGSITIETSEEGILRMCYAGTKALYIFVDDKQDRMVAVGQDYVKNDDRSVRYIWSEMNVLEVFRKRAWGPDDLYYAGKYINDPDLVIRVSINRGRFEESVKNEATGEITGWNCSGNKKCRVQIVFPPEAEKAIKNSEKVGFIFYAKVEKMPDGKIKVRALGTRKQGRGDDTVYKWTNKK